MLASAKNRNLKLSCIGIGKNVIFERKFDFENECLREEAAIWDGGEAALGKGKENLQETQRNIE